MTEQDTVWGGTRPRSAARYRDRVWRQPARRPRGRLRYTDTEWAVICRVAAAAGMRPGAWAQQAASEVAVAVDRGRPLDRDVVDALVAELLEHRRVMANIGGNVNQLATAANTAGYAEAALAAGELLRLVRRVILGSEQLASDLRRALL
ncbi:hypothetical protein FFT09_22660 [Saccharomonospora piscinae]|uniref:hypothetical protein n=1 Tax=Saccharomonospora piscinae TaxID=687388 RepID=UPI0011059576|nr:hypothetical protein [Saccharomonospora piscinae]TLW89232.1 hypothetical protein FFT09_22660 [Saccharomonospora piscinae]